MECVPLGPAPGQHKARLSQQGTMFCWRHSSASWRKPDPEPEPGGHLHLAMRSPTCPGQVQRKSPTSSIIPFAHSNVSKPFGKTAFTAPLKS